MCTLTHKVPSIAEFLAMNGVEIVKLPVNNCQPLELYQISFSNSLTHSIFCWFDHSNNALTIEFRWLHGISHQINHPVTNQILALKYFVNKFESNAVRVELFNMVIPKLKDSLSEVNQWLIDFVTQSYRFSFQASAIIVPIRWNVFINFIRIVSDMHYNR